MSASYSWTKQASGAWKLVDSQSGREGTDILTNIEILKFSDRSVALSISFPSSVQVAYSTILRADPTSGAYGTFASDLQLKLYAGTSSADAIREVIKIAGSSSSVAILAYQFFTGSTPSSGGMDYLVSPTGPNANNLNSAYYQSFSLENRYINFAVNLGKAGAGQATFQAGYGSLSLADSLSKAYATIFGSTPSAGKIDILLNGMVPDGLGGTETRAQYFAFYGQDGLNGLGTKAAMVGWLLGEAVKADIGDYALSNDAFLTAIANGSATYNIDLIGQFNNQSYHYLGM